MFVRPESNSHSPVFNQLSHWSWNYFMKNALFLLTRSMISSRNQTGEFSVLRDIRFRIFCLRLRDDPYRNFGTFCLRSFFRLQSNRSFRQRVSSPTTSSLILKSIRQRLIEGTVNRSLCNCLKSAIVSTDFVRLHWYASECNEKHFLTRNQTNLVQTQWFSKLRECWIKKRRFVFYRWKLCSKVFKYNQPLISLTDFVRLCCNASECDERP